MKIQIDNLMVEETEETNPCVISLSCAGRRGCAENKVGVCVCVWGRQRKRGLTD